MYKFAFFYPGRFCEAHNRNYFVHCARWMRAFPCFYNQFPQKMKRNKPKERKRNNRRTHNKWMLWCGYCYFVLLFHSILLAAFTCAVLFLFILLWLLCSGSAILHQHLNCKRVNFSVRRINNLIIDLRKVKKKKQYWRLE